jgi:hypothetical protein
MDHVDAREEPLECAPELHGLWNGIRHAEVTLEPIGRGYAYDEVAVGFLSERAFRFSPAAEDCDVVAAVGESPRDDLDEALDAADVRAEVGGHEQNASAV